MSKNSIYEPAWKVYESNPNAGEPAAEDGYVPRNRFYKPGYFGLMPHVRDTNYKVLNDPVLIRKKQEMRAVLREEYIKQAYDPYRSACADGGTEFDPQNIRYIAMLRTQSAFYRPSWKNLITSFSFMVLPSFLFFWIHSGIYDRNEKLQRSGKVSYADKTYKLLG